MDAGIRMLAKKTRQSENQDGEIGREVSEMDHSTKYCPTRHQRHSFRLKSYDYAQAGAYFIRICTYKQAYFFGGN